jgi:hypothetical protein
MLPPIRGRARLTLAAVAVLCVAPRPACAGSAGARDSIVAYDDLNVFAGAPVDAGMGPPLLLRDGLRIRFLEPDTVGNARDSLRLLREVAVGPDGSLRADSLPANAPLRLQVIAPDGAVLLSAHGPGLRAGANAGSPRVRRCVGCHAGHSALPVPPDDEAARWFNAATSAQVTVSSRAAGSAGAGALIDRRTRGAPREVAWISASPYGQGLRLRWPRPLEIRELALYGLRPSRAGRITVRECEVVLRLNGTELSRRLVNVPLDPEGTHLGVGLTVADEVEIDIRRATGLLSGRRAAALAEIEALARVP